MDLFNCVKQTVVIEDSDDEAVHVQGPVKAEPKLPKLDLRLQKPTVRKPKPVQVKTVVAASSSDDVFAPHPSVTTPNGLPAFLADKWTSVVMPALHLAIVQMVINKNFPRNTYKAKWGDPVVSRASARFAERRSAIGTSGTDIVTQHIITNEKILGTTQLIQDYARYALNKRGPALFKTPTPLRRIAITDPTDPNYVKAKGLFKSDFVISVLAPLLKVGSKGRPFGAVAMAAAAVERGWIKYQTGELVGSSKFTKHTAGAAVDGYLVAAHKLSENAWQRIIDACNEHCTAAEYDLDDTVGPSLDGVREDLYQPSSP
ncbi:hypothetical protein DFH07DRAFT_947948 [Mycena maculata]|uniref:Uncharacterized protein n=1 Tax=Mycena maculata TaxID=230809 RepID=A0AAD7KHJ1_9AGAR|nr:hypothetical protein DFH07DRAFT_947948 [Mycena maculata]